MTKAQMIVLSKKVALMFGLWYDEHKWKYVQNKHVLTDLCAKAALARASRGKLKTQEMNQKLSALLVELEVVPCEP